MQHHQIISLLVFNIAILVFPMQSYSGTELYRDISLANRQELRHLYIFTPSPISSFNHSGHAINWIAYQSKNIVNKVPEENSRRNLLRMIHYEATRYGLDPDLVLALIDVESSFNRFSVSYVGASGLMQVMPFWKEFIGDTKDSLFDTHTNLRYGCIILKHYLDQERGNIERALARYNGSLGNPSYSNLVIKKWLEKYRFQTLSHLKPIGANFV
jgi:soluble lytic murein transglycosylase-like protein